MSKVKIQGNASGTGVVTLTAPNTNTDRTITLPDEDITLGGGVDGIVSTANATAITINSSEQVGIGETSPQGTLHVKTSDSGATAVAGADDLIIEHADYGGMSILSENEGHIYFGDNEDADVGRIEYSHSTNSMIFRTNGSDALTIKSDGRGLSQFTAKAWCNFDGTNTTIRDSHNVSSITTSNTGYFNANFTNSMANANYAVSGSGCQSHTRQMLTFRDLATSNFSMRMVTETDGSLFNSSCISFHVFGD